MQSSAGEDPPMPPTSVRIATVTTRAEYPVANRISYQVRLSCGCEWWEHRALHEAPPIVGAPAYCCAMHAKSDAEGAGEAEVGYPSWVPGR
jgi:hypothetical protein